MRRLEEYNTTTNSKVYKRLRKMKYARCSLCPWHRKENGYWNFPTRSWKYFRKKQYKC